MLGGRNNISSIVQRQLQDMEAGGGGGGGGDWGGGEGVCERDSAAFFTKP